MKKIVCLMSRNLATMKKHAISSSSTVPLLGVSNKKPMKRTKNRHKKQLKKDFMFSYLISDTYMYNPLVSHQPTFDFPPPPINSSGMQEDVAMPVVEGRNKNFIEKVVDFLEADCYLYSPLIVDNDDHHVCVKTHVPHKTSEGVAMQKGRVEEDGDLSKPVRGRPPVVQKTVAYRESVKRVVR
ncbi:hypothetical protein QVD17_26260 [Tagetes erecta]|uniref:Uncharacterized protein n=1 Tax=Tagetes erecta TaxID=13708 RepID=A0AAD8NQM5_TARER|nr:hypothetical protein QVD17_26260 [Tagetes erecta]